MSYTFKRVTPVYLIYTLDFNHFLNGLIINNLKKSLFFFTNLENIYNPITSLIGKFFLRQNAFGFVIKGIFCCFEYKKCILYGTIYIVEM
ncbi:MAG: hypothetical protein ACD_4C00107G0002 [uncultured bacterium (gcode 4)]|uniref:Uncharacterized protein n=1 Tax=uncultured bacterium (gcode 4) TaxID=1234023 RepID=K2F738_9BACT|nr:MAG: hypothetical protein ACD_4C00107G0002 [uncultured bacterium (gcode 4)]